MPSRKLIRFYAGTLLGAFAACCLVGCGSGAQGVVANTSTAPVLAPTAASIWVGAWGASPTNAQPSSDDNPGGSEQSFRFLIYPTVSGTQERIRFSNYFGTTPITIGASRLSIGQSGSPAVDTANDAKVTFNGGSGSVTIPPGQIIVSDPVQLTYSYGQTLAVSVYLSGTFPPLTRHDNLFNQSYKTVAGAGDKTADLAGGSFTQSEGDWLLLNGVDVYGSYQGTVVMLGSSTTDGFHSNYGSTNVYPVPNVPVPGQYTSRLPDLVAKRLNAAGYRIGVINAGIGGNTLAPDSSNATNHVQNALDRLDRDVLSQPNVIAIVSYLGAIDLRSVDCKSAPTIESAAQQLISRAAAAKIRVVLATLPPSAFCTNSAQANFGPTPTTSDPYAGGEAGSLNPAEVQRGLFNTWIRSAGAALPGVAGIADFDKALADPTRPDFMLPLYNSYDNYHPNGVGYDALAGAVPINLLVGP